MRADDAIVNDEPLFGRIYGDEYGEQHLADAGEYTQDVIDCTTDICNYIYHTRPLAGSRRSDPRAGNLVTSAPRRGALLREFFRDGLTEMHRRRDTAWRGVS